MELVNEKIINNLFLVPKLFSSLSQEINQITPHFATQWQVYT